VLNARKGHLLELAFLHYGQWLGSQHPMNTAFVDARLFHSLNSRKVLALHAVGQFSAGQVPFNQMSMLGGESVLRGHYLGRLRSNQMLALQAELRALPFAWSQRLGGAVFASLGSVSPQWPFPTWSGSAGAGLRYLLFPEKDVYTRIDVGFHSAGYGLYFYIGEAF
jgi:outer membrane protein assembly factor BamA